MGRVLAGGFEVDERCWNDGKVNPNPSRETAPEDEVKRFLEANTRRCQWLDARISHEQCVSNRERGLYLCGRCDDPIPEFKAKEATKPRGRSRRQSSKSPWHENPGFIPRELQKRAGQKMDIGDDSENEKAILVGAPLPSRAEPSRAEPSRAEPSRAEPSRAEPSRAEPSRAEIRRLMKFCA